MSINTKPPFLVIVMTRYPEPGRAKTRLIPALGAERAAAVSGQLTRWTLQQLSPLRSDPGLRIEIHFEGGSQRLIQDRFGVEWHYVRQGDGDLGDRLVAATGDAFDRGVCRLVVVGTDCPALDATRIRQTFDALHNVNVVVGPSVDGGYYLVGLNRKCPELFQEIAWGTSTVLSQTLQKARSLGLSATLLDPLSDVDSPEDLDQLPQEMQSW